MAVADLQANIEEAARLYLAGAQGNDLAMRYGVVRETAIKHLRHHGVVIRKRGHGIDGPTKRLLTREQMQEVIRRYREGATTTELGIAFGVSKSTVRNNLVRHGEQRRLGGPQSKGRRIDTNGYVWVQVPLTDPMASMLNAKRYVLEHRLVIARHIGRPLVAGETVHHKNGVRDDNRIENLELHHRQHGGGQAFRCGDCGSRNVVAVGLNG